MDPMGVLANEYVRRLSGRQFEESPRHDRRARDRDHAAARRRAPRLRRVGRAFRRMAEALVN